MNVALIFAGGVGKRMNTKAKPKQFLELNSKPIIIHTIEHFENHQDIDAIAVVCVEDWIEYLKKQLKKFNINKVRWVVSGGKNPQESTRNGLYAIQKDYKGYEDDIVVLIHDGVRPLINESIITGNIETVKKYGNAITVVPATETIITVDKDGDIFDVMDRSVCHLARAPQSFILKDIIKIHEQSLKDGELQMIDSAMLMRHYGVKLHTIEGPIENIKITNPSDFYIFRAIVEARENSQIWGI